jgi:hypothetical protein
MAQRETGDRMIGWGAYFQVSGLGHQAPGSGIQVRVQVQEICHRFSHLSSTQPSTLPIRQPLTAKTF